MVDDLTTAQEPMPDSGAPAPKQGLAGLLSTTTGRIVAAVVALLVLGGIVAVVFFLVVPVFMPGATGGGAAVTPRPAAGGSAESTTSVEESAPVAPEPVTNADVFTFRDIFEPLIGPEPSATEGSATAEGEADTLYLQDVVTEDGERKAVLLWNGKTYTLAAGETIPDTPWKVVSVGTSSVTMLYGDSTVTLGVGQGFASK